MDLRDLTHCGSENHLSKYKIHGIMENSYPVVKNTIPASEEVLKLNRFWSMFVSLLETPLFIGP